MTKIETRELILDRLSPAQRAELDDAIVETEHGITVPAGVTFDDLAQRFGVFDAQ